MKKRGVVRPKYYDRPGHRSQMASTADLKAPPVDELLEDVDPYDLFDQLSAGEKAALDPTLSYSSGWRDGRDGRPIRGNSPEYEDGYLSGRKHAEQLDCEQADPPLSDEHCAVCCRSKGEPHADECYSGGVV